MNKILRLDYRNLSRVRPLKHTGQALLAFLLVILASASYFLVQGLNDHTNALVRSANSSMVLNQAKQALLLYAMNYPELRDKQEKGPGFLPCPDQKNNGSPESGCAITTTTTLGRLPFRILGLDDLRDSSGERLWYSLSDNFKNTSSLYTVINSETPGLLRVDGVDDIVAVIIAPGAPVAAQSARPSNAAADYLEGDNASAGDGSFVTTVPTAAGEFNDQLVTITRAELMAYVERRVLSEVRHVLHAYTEPDEDGAQKYAYPWLAPYADPKADYRILRGKHSKDCGKDKSITGCDNLTDTRRDFINAVVAVGDIVRNVTDGSVGVVAGVTKDSLTIEGLSLGDENDFDEGDIYYIDRRGLANVLSGEAKAGSIDLTLRDSNKNFKAIGVLPGDVIENVSDNSTWVIATVDTDSVTVKRPSGGTDNAFDVGDHYTIRSNAGVATAGSAALTLEDVSVNFTAMNVAEGDLIVNITDGSYGRVSAVTNTTLTVDSLQFGNANVFAENDVYEISRFNGVANTRFGLLPVHEAGRKFPTGFTVEYSARQADGNTFVVSTTGSEPRYESDLQKIVESSVIDGSINVATKDGLCTWTTAALLECVGTERLTDLEGIITAGSGSNSAAVLIDSTKDFGQLGVKRGDIVQNYDDDGMSLLSGTADAGSDGTRLVDAAKDFSVYQAAGHYNIIVRNTSQAGQAQAILAKVVDRDTVHLIDYDGLGVDPVNFSPGDGYTFHEPYTLIVSNTDSPTRLTTRGMSSTPPTLDAGGYYRIKPWTEKIVSNAGAGSHATKLVDTTKNFTAAGVQVGDIVEISPDDSAAWFAEVTSVDATSLGITPFGGEDNTFATGEKYIVYYGYVNSRQYITNLRFKGKQTATANAAGVKQRNVCIGYADCTSVPTEEPTNALPYYDLGIEGQATAAGTTALTLVDAKKDFKQQGVMVGDVVMNVSDGSARIVETVNRERLTVFALHGDTETENVFDAGDDYRITRPMVTLQDVSDDGTVVARRSVAVPNGGSSGSIRVQGLSFYLSQKNQENGELPAWFVKNGWHKLVYVAYSSAVVPPKFSPGGNNQCSVAAGDCLDLHGPFGTSHDNDVIVLSSGMALSTNDRSTGSIRAYYEQDKAIEINGTVTSTIEANDSFNKGDRSNTFNDQAMIVSP